MANLHDRAEVQKIQEILPQAKGIDIGVPVICRISIVGHFNGDYDVKVDKDGIDGHDDEGGVFFLNVS